jgi:hypothetical protein
LGTSGTFGNFRDVYDFIRFVLWWLGPEFGEKPAEVLDQINKLHQDIDKDE